MTFEILSIILDTLLCYTNLILAIKKESAFFGICAVCWFLDLCRLLKR